MPLKGAKWWNIAMMRIWDRQADILRGRRGEKKARDKERNTKIDADAEN